MTDPHSPRALRADAAAATAFSNALENLKTECRGDGPDAEKAQDGVLDAFLGQGDPEPLRIALRMHCQGASALQIGTAVQGLIEIAVIRAAYRQAGQ